MIWLQQRCITVTSMWSMTMLEPDRRRSRLISIKKINWIDYLQLLGRYFLRTNALKLFSLFPATLHALVLLSDLRQKRVCIKLCGYYIVLLLCKPLTFAKLFRYIQHTCNLPITHTRFKNSYFLVKKCLLLLRLLFLFRC